LPTAHVRWRAGCALMHESGIHLFKGPRRSRIVNCVAPSRGPAGARSSCAVATCASVDAR
jgi:hypothetical protein